MGFLCQQTPGVFGDAPDFCWFLGYPVSKNILWIPFGGLFLKNECPRDTIQGSRFFSQQLDLYLTLATRTKKNSSSCSAQGVHGCLTLLGCPLNGQSKSTANRVNALSFGFKKKDMNERIQFTRGPQNKTNRK